MTKFGTQEWADLFMKAVNENEAYAKAADWWTGNFIFQIDPHGGLTNQINLWVGLHKGDCTGTKILEPDEAYTLLQKGEASTGKPYEVEYIYAARVDVWEQIMKKELDPIRAMLAGKAKVVGDMPKILRATEAAKQLVASATTIQTEFYG
jgi:putative sterol carrier protein